MPPRGRIPQNVFQREFEGFFRPDQAVGAIGDADDLPFVLEDGGLGSGADHGVEAGRVAAYCGDADAAMQRMSDIGFGGYFVGPGWLRPSLR